MRSDPTTSQKTPASRRQQADSTAAEPRPPANDAADLLLLAVVGAALVPVGLLVIAVGGVGLPAVVLAFIVLVLTTAAVTILIRRAVDQPASNDH